MSDALTVIRAAEQQLDEFLGRYGSGSLAPDQPLPDFAPLMQALDSARPILEQLPLPADRDPALSAAAREYGEKLKLLEMTLERLKPQLEARRDEIHARLAKVQAALSWARSFSQTR